MKRGRLGYRGRGRGQGVCGSAPGWPSAGGALPRARSFLITPAALVTSRFALAPGSACNTALRRAGRGVACSASAHPSFPPGPAVGSAPGRDSAVLHGVCSPPSGGPLIAAGAGRRGWLTAQGRVGSPVEGAGRILEECTCFASPGSTVVPVGRGCGLARADPGLESSDSHYSAPLSGCQASRPERQGDLTVR
jgi:hypothetical protein